jgi:ATP-dependent RNA helicase DeaD
MARYRAGKCHLLIATDVAARGLDIAGVDAVINFDLPNDSEYYVHRIGRTGRAGKTGTAISIIARRDAGKLKEIERGIGARLIRAEVPTKRMLAEAKVGHILEDLEASIANTEQHETAIGNLQVLVEKGYTWEQIALGFAAKVLPHLPDAKDEFSAEARQERSSKEERSGGRYERGGDRNSRSSGGDRGERGGSYGGRERSGDAGGERRPKGEFDNTNMVTLKISAGRMANVRPSDIVGAIAGEAQISSKMIGQIVIKDKHTFVDIDQSKVKQVLTSVNNSSIKGRPVKVELAY